MMEGLRLYVLAVTGAAMVCAILCSLVQKTGAKDLIRMLCGVFLTIILLHPIGEINISEVDLENILHIQEGELTAAYGEALAKEARLDIIKQETEAYILDKARALNAELGVKVMMDSEMEIPKGAELSGAVSPYAKRQLSQMMCSDLGIGTEEQQWIG